MVSSQGAPPLTRGLPSRNTTPPPPVAVDPLPTQRPSPPNPKGVSRDTSNATARPKSVYQKSLARSANGSLLWAAVGCVCVRCPAVAPIVWLWNPRPAGVPGPEGGVAASRDEVRGLVDPFEGVGVPGSMIDPNWGCDCAVVGNGEDTSEGRVAVLMWGGCC